MPAQTPATTRSRRSARSAEAACRLIVRRERRADSGADVRVEHEHAVGLFADVVSSRDRRVACRARRVAELRIPCT